MSAPPPSSFDQDVDFYQESRFQKLKRRLIEEPLIPLGCGLTVWALYEASRSIKTGDKNRTNRMFRRRIYAQGFTLLAMLAGSVYWDSDRAKRRQYDDLVEEKNRKEKHEKWVKELEIREAEDAEMLKLRKELVSRPPPIASPAPQVSSSSDSADQSKTIRSVLESTETRSPVGIAAAAMSLLGGRWR